MKNFLSFLLLSAATSKAALRGLEEDVPFELHAGKCLNASDAWALLPESQRINQVNFENFEAFCGFGGSCFGDDEGCCRFANGQTIECDTDREFNHANVRTLMLII